MRNVLHEIPVPPDVPPALVQLRSRWRPIVIACAVAAVASLSVSLMLPRQYTSTCRIVIDPPAGTDARVSTAVSPIYLESLRTYELFASSDDLFLQAVKKFDLRRDSTPIERLKKKILKVEVLRNTKILEIEVTLPDPVKAHELASYLAQAAVSLNRTVGLAADNELRLDAEKQSGEARRAMEHAQQLWADAATKNPIEQVSGELDADIELRSKLQGELSAAQADLSESEQSSPVDGHPIDVKGPRARVEELRGQLDRLDSTIAREQALVAELSSLLNRVEGQRKSAEANMKTAESRLNDVRFAAGYRGERLSIIDPGIVPERPSSPNIALNIAVAVFAAFVLVLMYVLIQIGFRNPIPYD